MHKISVPALSLAILTIMTTFLGSPAFATEQTFLTQNGLAGKTPRQMVEYINQLKQDRPLNFSASITPTQLNLSDGSEGYSYPLNDKFYLSFAPYINQTHPCFNHNLSSCTGELTNSPFKVTIKDQSVKVILDQTLTSYQNGFIGVWLPRNITGTINVTYNGLSASTPFATASDSRTCLTNLKLEQKL